QEGSGGDALGVVGYSSDVTVLAPVGEADVEEAKDAVAALSPTYATNLYGGLETGLSEAGRIADQWASEDDGRGVEIRVVLISDGLANQGETRAEQIAGLVEGLPRGVRVSTIGVGPDCDHQLLA